MKHDALTMALLYDYYGELLTEKQRTCFDLYYNQDLSLSEIAEDLGVTRQGVHDTLARPRRSSGTLKKRPAASHGKRPCAPPAGDRIRGPCAAGRSGRPKRPRGRSSPLWTR